ncbi:MAG: protein-export chaperone SecB [Rickettsiaceae bacterium]|nr:protein-export chaperone SecB [Rickettsiaceae bacterium]
MTQKEQKEQSPHIAVVSQYIKDLSIENPNAPSSLVASTTSPSVELSLDLDISKLEDSDNSFEVAIKIESTAKQDDLVLFVVELVYAGIFVLQNIPEDQYEPILAIHCPNLIFPFVRRIISDVTAESGFQPLRIDPIDFSRLYKKKLEDMGAEGEA